MNTNEATVILPDYLKPTVPLSTERIGGKHDGGYLIPSSILGNCDSLVSFGINLDWGFESEILALYPGIRIYTYDKTTQFSYVLYWSITRTCYAPISWKKRHLLAWYKVFDYVRFRLNPRVRHTAKFVGTEDNDGTVSVERIFGGLDTNARVFVKVDIEGAEYLIIDHLLRYKSIIHGFVFEFHNLANRKTFESAINVLLIDYVISHVHVNNVGGLVNGSEPSMLEITLIRKDLVQGELFSGGLFRSVLDSPNDPSLPNVTIKFIDIAGGSCTPDFNL